MTVRDIIDRLLLHLSTEERDIPENPTYPGRISAALGALNGAAQELVQRANPEISCRNRSAILHAPVNLTLTLTAESRSATVPVASWKTWMDGCSIRIGSGTWNRIEEAVSGDTNATLTLLDPWLGASGSFDATVYADCVILDAADTALVMPAVAVDSTGASKELRPANLSLVEWTDPDAPAWYDTKPAPDGTARIYVVPQPKESFIIRYRVKLRMGGWTDADLGDGETDSPDIPVPSDMAESLLLPIATQRFTASPFFRNREALDEINRQYLAAINGITDFRTNRPKAIIMTP